MQTDDLRGGLLLVAFERRRHDIVARLGAYPDNAAVPSECAAGPEAEEALRAAMVVFLPKIRAGRFTTDELQRYLLLLERLFDAARGPDLRFVDAWNNAFEALANVKISSAEGRAAMGRFCRLYARVVDHHIRGSH